MPCWWEVLSAQLNSYRESVYRDQGKYLTPDYWELHTEEYESDSVS